VASARGHRLSTNLFLVDFSRAVDVNLFEDFPIKLNLAVAQPGKDVAFLRAPCARPGLCRLVHEPFALHAGLRLLRLADATGIVKTHSIQHIAAQTPPRACALRALRGHAAPRRRPGPLRPDDGPPSRCLLRMRSRNAHPAVIQDETPMALHLDARLELRVQPLLVERVELRAFDAEADVVLRDIGCAQRRLELRDGHVLWVLDLERLPPPLHERAPLHGGRPLEWRHHPGDARCVCAPGAVGRPDGPVL